MARLSARIWWLLWAAFWLSGCAAPHDNPLDPESDRYRPGLTPPDLVGRVHSERVARAHLSTPTYTVVSELLGSDAGLQDSVWVSFAGRDPWALVRSSVDLPWTRRDAASVFDDPTDPSDPPLSLVIGLPFAFGSIDYLGTRHEIGPAYLFRVIHEAPMPLYPDSEETVGPCPTLTWEGFAADFRPCYYRAAVYKSMTDYDLNVWTSTLLDDTARGITVLDSLEAGSYFWTVTVLDTFTNSSRSKELYFNVETIGG